MPRPERALDAEAGPAAAFAAELRQLRRRAGNPGYRQLSERAGYSVATLANAGGGRRLPSLPVTVALVRACGGDVSEWERRWRLAAAEEARLREAAAASADPSAGSPPYLGLSGYEVGDADRFFGRQRMVSQLVGLLGRQKFLAVFGVSGSGKSSLLRAGLVPAIVAGGLTTNPAPHGEGGGTVESAPLPVLMTPGVGPIAALREALAEVLPQRAVLLVLDQFEEVFTLCASPVERGRFVAELAGLVADPDTRVVLGVRADFYARCAVLPELAALIAGANVPLGPLSDEELREVVTGPARLAGLTVERALVTRIVSEASGQPGALPLVSHALLETWRQRRSELLTEAGYDAAGGMAGAIAQTAEAVYLGLRADRRKPARLVLTRLVTLGEGVEDTRCRAARHEMDFPHVDEVLDRLAAARLVTLGDDTVELAHEALIGAWPRLQRWLSDNREGLRIQHQLTESTRTWLALDRDTGCLYRGVRLATAREWATRGRRHRELTTAERMFLDASVEAQHRERAIAARRVRQLRYLAAALAMLLIAASAVSVIAVRQRQDAVRASREAISRQLAVQALALVDSDPSTAMLLSVQALRLAPTVEARSALLSMSARRAYQGELLGHTGAVSKVAFSRDGRTVFSVGRDQTVRVWDTAGRRLAATLTGHRAWLRSMALSPDGRLLATGGDDNKVVLWDLAHQKPVATLSGHSGQIATMAFSPDGHTLATGASDAAMLWDITSRARLATLNGHTGAVLTLAFSPNGRSLATGGDATTVIVWDVASRSRRSTLSHHLDGEVFTVEFSPDGRTLASAGTDTSVLLWDTDRWMLRATLPTHGPNTYALNFNPRSGLLAAAGEGGVITLWDSGRSSPATEAGDVRDIAISPDGATLAVATDQRLELWNTQQRNLRAILADGQPINAVAFSPDSATLAAAVGRPGEAGWVTLWTLGTDAAPLTLTGHTDRVLDVAFSPDGRLLATASVDRTVMLWDVPHRTRLVTLTGHRDAVNGVAFSPDGRTLTTAGHDPAIMLWDVEHYSRLATLTGHTGWVRSAVFSPDGRSLASEDTDQTVILWDVQRRTRVQTFTDHADAVYTGIAFSPDSHKLAYTGGEHTIVLWDTAGRAPIARLSGHTQAVRSVAFTPDGQTLAASSADRTIAQWNVDPDQTVKHICTAVVRNFTQQQWHQFIPDLPYERTCSRGGRNPR